MRIMHFPHPISHLSAIDDIAQYLVQPPPDTLVTGRGSPISNLVQTRRDYGLREAIVTARKAVDLSVAHRHL